MPGAGETRSLFYSQLRTVTIIIKDALSPLAGKPASREMLIDTARLQEQYFERKALNAGRPVPKGAIGVVAPGTGLGESFLTWEDTRYVAHSSEGGHSDFAPTDQRQIALLQYMLKKFDHVSVEHVCSGIGVPNIYAYLRDVEHIPEDPDVVRQLAAAGDPSVVIINAASDPRLQANCVKQRSSSSHRCSPVRQETSP